MSLPTPKISHGLVSVCGVCAMCAKTGPGMRHEAPGEACELWLNAKELREYIASLTAALGEIDKRPAIVVGVDPAAPGGDRTVIETITIIGKVSL